MYVLSIALALQNELTEAPKPLTTDHVRKICDFVNKRYELFVFIWTIERVSVWCWSPLENDILTKVSIEDISRHWE